mmetsp:Transcript_4513/g.6756  ORF Transcript_4513/g.6756 Transcript_4513/m.6756 type:complete len:243 (+) Transcript_4513:76-804(+)
MGPTVEGKEGAFAMNGCRAGKTRTKKGILLFVPNLIGYARLSFAVLAAMCLPNYVWTFIFLMLLSMFTDLLDGIAARKLNQCSRYGELLDIIADNACRSLSWLAIFVVSGSKTSCLDAALCLIIPTMEWLAMLATQLEAFDTGRHWKTQADNAPWLLKKIFENGFKNPLGGLAILGIFALPLVKLARLSLTNGSQFALILDIITPILYIGRALAAWAEFWVISSFFDKVLEMDLNPPPSKKD